MEKTQTYKNKTTATDSGTSFRKAVKTFVNRHAGVFKALTRVGAPYGESIRYQAAENGIIDVRPEQQIGRLQQQIDELSQTIASLRIQESTRPNVAKTDYKQSNSIGINRFRALQAEC